MAGGQEMLRRTLCGILLCLTSRMTRTSRSPRVRRAMAWKRFTLTLPSTQKYFMVEQDIIRSRCLALRQHMRKRPCLPIKSGGESMTYADVSFGGKLPLYTCPYLDCRYSSNERATFLHHVAGGVSDPCHLEMLEVICKDDMSWMTRLDYVYGAAAVAERERWPRLGLCTTRRSLNALCQRYNDDQIQCLACFICCQLRTTSEGFAAVNLDTPATDAPVCQHEISMRSCGAFQELERDRPGSLLNNCSYDLWRRRYVLRRRKRERQTRC